MDFSVPLIIIISFVFFAVAFLYSSVGHGGASGYLAVLSFFAVAPKPMSTTALILNLFVAGAAFISFARAKHLHLGLTWPFLLSSVPAAFVGGLAHVSARVYVVFLAIVLLLASFRFLLVGWSDGEQSFVKAPSLLVSVPVGAVIGLLSGIVGVGGGIFLSPLILLLRWADPKTTAATSAAFIFVNSVAGILGRLTSDTFEVGTLLPFLFATFIGGLLGSHLGAVRYSNRTIKRALGIVLLIASIKLVISAV